MTLSLASASPRRKMLLSLPGWTFNIIPANVDETPKPKEDPHAYVFRMAQEKALAAAKHPEARQVIIAADTTVVDNTHILGKPENPEEAREMLQQLRGRIHHVYTAIAVLRQSDKLLLTDICSTPVPMRVYSDGEITAYIETGDPMDKAGGYAIQHKGFAPVASLNGCYANVVGLPLCHLTHILHQFGITPYFNVAEQCQSSLEYTCLIHGQILGGLR